MTWDEFVKQVIETDEAIKATGKQYDVVVDAYDRNGLADPEHFEVDGGGYVTITLKPVG